MPYRNKTYIAFDGDTDMKYYRLMTAWSENDQFSVDFYNAHDINSARDSSEEESIKSQLRERFINSKAFIILIGEKTRYLTKFVKWEVEVAIKLDLPIIAININGNKTKDDRSHPALDGALAIYIPFKEKIISYAMDNWPESHRKYRKNGDSGYYVYKESVYKKLGLD